jgi:glycosyltransferase involved in cell wall biosynthesis
VALFTGAYNHIADGVSLTLNRLVRSLGEYADVRVFAPTIADPPVAHAGTLQPAPSVAAPGRPEYRVSLGLTRGLRRSLGAFDPHLVHIATPDLLGLGALRWARRHDVPAIATYHTHFSSYLRYYRAGLLEGALWRYLRWFYRRCEAVYVPSQSMIDALGTHGIGGNLHVWARGVDATLFTPDKRSDDWRARYGLEPDEVVVTFVGRLVLEKGLDVFADVVEGLRQRGLAHRSLVVGDGPERAAMQARLGGSGPDATVFTGHLRGDDLAHAYASSDVFVFPSETETFGNVTLEAMASGVPAVCADATGSRSLVADGETGLLCPPRDSAAFLDATARLVADADLRASMSRAALERARRFSWPVILDEMLGHYRRHALSPLPELV